MIRAKQHEHTAGSVKTMKRIDKQKHQHKTQSKNKGCRWLAGIMIVWTLFSVSLLIGAWLIPSNQMFGPEFFAVIIILASIPILAVIMFFIITIMTANEIGETIFRVKHSEKRKLKRDE